MTDKKQTSPTNKASDKSNAETKVVATTAAKVSGQSTSKESLSKKNANKTSTNTKQLSAQKSKRSKTAILSLFLTLTAIAGIVAGYFLLQQQHSKSMLALEQKNMVQLNQFQQQLSQALAKQKNQLTHQLKQVATQVQSTNQVNNASHEKVLELVKQTEKLEQSIQQRQPSDWLIHEAEYLIRIAARTLWLEQDTRAPLGLLKEADARLKELNDPRFLSVRALIHQDRQSLAQMPTLNTDDISS